MTAYEIICQDVYVCQGSGVYNMTMPPIYEGCSK